MSMMYDDDDEYDVYEYDDVSLQQFDHIYSDCSG